MAERRSPPRGDVWVRLDHGSVARFQVGASGRFEEAFNMMVRLTSRASKPAKTGETDVLLVASGDLRLSANQELLGGAGRRWKRRWPKRSTSCGYRIVASTSLQVGRRARLHRLAEGGLGGLCKRRSARRRLIVAEAVWQYSHHVLAGLMAHEGPMLTVANWSGTWPGLVGLLNLNGSLTKAGVQYSTLWSEDFSAAAFRRTCSRWLDKGKVRHKTEHVLPLADVSTLRGAARRLGESLAVQLQREKAIMGIFDEGCMGMYNAIIPDSAAQPHGRLQRAAQPIGAVLRIDAGRRRRSPRGAALDGRTRHAVPLRVKHHETDLTDDQILDAMQDVHCRRADRRRLRL